MSNERTEHWQQVYATKGSDAVSWYRPHLDTSLRLLERAGLGAGSRLIDVGGGASTLVDDLLARGLTAVTVLDIAKSALDAARQRLGARAEAVTWLAGDVTRVALPAAAYDLWHDRAVLHFLVDPADVTAYVAQVRRALAPGGHAVIGGFAGDGPERCSGLPVARRDAADIAALLGAGFELLHAEREAHVTPWGAPQAFAYALLRKSA
ncbi:MAG: class I SAM-dependent methyltransferase [Mizugakiibacter sp.]|uniref:class I SAM-dependent methyltransferase n=1 Tax=Mizugakiibacter sp. TaxID=1972610 RepID=UPI0031BF139F|nr:class I SAM-dependent methyltransferase [Xanthomonadaceae bacterium]